MYIFSRVKDPYNAINNILYNNQECQNKSDIKKPTTVTVLLFLMFPKKEEEKEILITFLA